MNINTTYVMCDEVIRLLEEAEEKTNYPKEELLMLALRKMMKDCLFHVHIPARGRALPC